MYQAGATLKWRDTYSDGAWHEFAGPADRAKLERYPFADYKVVGRRKRLMDLPQPMPSDGNVAATSPKSTEEALIDLVHSAWAEAVFNADHDLNVAFNKSRTARQLEKLVMPKS